MKKQRQFILSALLIVLTSLTAYGQSVGEQFTVGDIKYKVTTHSVFPSRVEIADYTGPGGVVVIPSTLKHQGSDYDVTAIGNNAFFNNGLTGVTFTYPSHVTSIGHFAFARNQLTSVKIPSSVTMIGSKAFGNNQLTSIVIPDNVTHIGTWAFYDNELSDITLGTKVQHIHYRTFSNNNLASVTLPGNIKGIGAKAFSENRLTEVTILGNVKNIGAEAFSENQDLVLVTVEANNPPTLHADAFSNRSQIAVVVPKGASLAAYETAGWTGFKSITEAAQVGYTFIAGHITYEITSIAPHTVTATGYHITGGTVTIPSTVVHGLNTYKVTAIGTDAFRQKGLTGVTIPNGVTSIGQAAFRQNQLESVVIPDNVTYIGTWAFVNNQLSSITLGANVEHIGYSTFRNNNLASVTLPGKVGKIRHLAFSNNPIKKVTAQGVATVPAIVTQNTFSNRSQIDVVVPKGASISAYNNAGWSGFGSITEVAQVGDTFIAGHITYKITSLDPHTITATGYTGPGGVVTIPSTVVHGPNTYEVTSIGAIAFHNKGLTGVTIPETVTTIGGFAFTDNQLTYADIPETVTSIGTAAFRGNKLTEVTIPGSVPEIGREVFSFNQLTRVTIPDGVTSIGKHAFVVNPLDLVTVEATTPPTLGANVFHGEHTSYRHRIDLVVPSGTRQAYLDNGWTGFKSITEALGIGDTFIAGHITYKVTSINPGKTVTAIDYSITGGAVTIPSTVSDGLDTYEVTAIGTDAFREKGLTEVTIPNGVTSIGLNAFRQNQLQSVVIPGNVTHIGTWAFRNNRLSSITLGANVELIGYGTFRFNNLASVTLPGKMGEIRQLAFADNPITKVTAHGVATVPTIVTVTGNTFSNRSQIAVVVPKGASITAYNNAGWTGFGSITEVAQVGDTFIADHITYEITSLAPSFEVTATGYNTAGGSVTIPQTVNHQDIAYEVTAIGNNAFREKGLTGVAFTSPSHVTSIGDYAFRDNQLAGVTIPNSVIHIERDAFINNDLTSIVIPNSVTSIGQAAFWNNELSSVTFTSPSNVISIGQSAFGMNQLAEVTIPDGVTSIEINAFVNNRLTSVVIPNSVTSIDAGAFGTNQLEEVTIPNSVTSIGTDAFSANPNLHLVTVEANNPPTLHENAFVNPNRNQIAVVVPSGTRQAYLDNGWTGFESITEVAQVGGTFIAGHITYEITSLAPSFEVTATGYNTAGGTLVTIPSTVVHGNTYKVTAIGDWAFWNNELSSVTFTSPGNVTSIGQSAFGKNQLAGVTIPDGVTSIGQDAFYDNQLTSVVIPGSVTSIGQRAFGTNQLEEITIPNSVTSIGQWVFARNKLTGVTIPGSVESIGYQAFYDNLDLVLVRVEANDPPTLDENAFQSRNQIDLVVPPSKVQTYKDSGWTGFRTISSLTDVGDQFTVGDFRYEITSISPNVVKVVDYTGAGPHLEIPISVQSIQNVSYSVTAIGNEAFNNKGLTGVTIPDGVTSIGQRAFGANQLAEVTIPDGVTSIGDYAFRNNQLEEVTIPNTVTSIGQEAFYDNQLTNVVIPESVTSIGNQAFVFNPLVLLTVEALVPPTLGAYVFYDNPRNQIDLVVPVGALNAYNNPANDWTGFGSITGVAQVGDTFIAGHITYEITSLDPRTITATGYTGPGGTVTIPSTVVHDDLETYTVTAIGTEAFREKGITEVTIPNGVTSIALNAFRQNQLESVVIPGNVTTIGTWAFRNNQLSSITLGANVELIGYGTFRFNNLASVTLPGKMGEIRQLAFADNPITKVTAQGVATVPTIVTVTGNTFSNRNQIAVFVPKAASITAYNNAGWTGFGSITEVPGINDTFTAENITYQITSLDPHAITATGYSVTGGTVTIPSTVVHGPDTYEVTAIGNSAFWNNELTGVTFTSPSHVTSIEDYAFGDNLLEEVTIPNSVTRIGQDAFYDNQLTSVVIPGSVTSIGQRAFGTNQLEEITIPNSVTSIGQWVFARNKLTGVTIPGSVESIGYQAFYDNLDLVLVRVEANDPPTLDENAFQSRNQIDLVVPIGTRQAYEHAGWTGFKSTGVGDQFTVGDFRYEITSISPNVVKVVDYTGAGPHLEIPISVQSIQNVSYSVTAIGNEAFYNNQLTSVEIPNSVTSIGDYAFGNNQLAGVTIPDGVTSIGINAFINNDLTSVTIPGSVTVIEKNAFWNNELSSVTFTSPSNVTSIGINAFGKNQLAEVTIPGSVTSIGQGAFNVNPDLFLVRVEANNPPALDENAFQSRNQIDLVVPIGTRQAYEDAGWTGFKSTDVGDQFTVGDFRYEITSISPNVVKIVDYTGAGPHLEIPISVQSIQNVSYSITAIGNEAFYSNQLTSVEIPNSVTSIGDYAFGNNQLAGVTIPDGVTSIGSSAFINNDLTSVTIPGSVTVIEKNAFWNNELTGVTFTSPSNVTSIGINAFGKNQLTSIAIPESVTSLGAGVFRDNLLERVTIPDGVTSIGSSAFRNNELTGVTIPNSVTSIGSSAFLDNQLTSVNIPDGVTSIGSSAFRGNELTGVTIPNSVTSIGGWAFAWNQLERVTIPDDVTSIDPWAFGSNQLTNVEIPNSVTHIGNSAFAKNQLTSVTIPDGVTSIGSSAFAENKLISVNIPNSVTSIGEYAFAWNQLTSSVTIGEKVTSIGSGAFQDNQLASVTILGSVTRIESYTFWENQLTEVTIPDGVTSIEHYAFARNQLERVTIPNSVTSIKPRAFSENQLTGVTFTSPSNLTSIGGSAFRDNELTGVTIPDGVTLIDSYAFKENQLTGVTIPNSVTYIGDRAFRDNPDLDLVTVEANDPPTLHADAFQNADRGQIGLIVPIGKEQAYLNKGWTDFASIAEGILVSINAPAQVDNLASFPVTITFGENVTGFTQEDIDVVNATLVDGSFSPVNSSASTYTIELTPMTPIACEGIITIDVPANAATGVNSSPNLPANTTVTVSDPPMTPQLSTTVSTVCAGQDAVFTIEGTEGDVVTYEDGTSTRTVTIPAGGTATVPVNGVSSNTTLTLTQVTRGNCNVAVTSTNTTTATVTVKDLPMAPGVSSSPIEYCVDDMAIALTASGDNLLWYTSPTDDTGDVTAPTPNTATAGTTFHYVSQTNSNGCESERTGIKVTVNPTPSAPAIRNSPVQYCVGDQANPLTATATGANSLSWYTTQTGGTGSSTAPTPTTTTAGSTSWYVSQTTNDCESERAEIVVTVNAIPVAPTVSSNSPVCPGDDAIFTITGTEGDVVTYEGTSMGTATIEAGGTVEVTVNQVSSDATLTLTEVTNGSCSISLMETAIVTVNALPSAPTLSTNSPVCPGDDAIFTITGTEGDVVTYSGALSGTATIEASGTVEVMVNQVSSDVTLNLEEVSNGNCSVSPLTETATVIVNAPSAPTVSSSPIEYCAGQPADALTASGTDLRWYTTATGGSAETTAPTPSTTTAGSTSYYVTQTTHGCESDRAEIVVTVNALPVAPTVSSPIEYCLDQTAEALTATGTHHLLWYTSATGGLGTSTALIPNTATAESTYYYVSQRNTNGCESQRAEIVVTIVEVCPAQIGDGFTASGMDYETTATESQVLAAGSNNEINVITLYPNPARDKVHINPGPGQTVKQVNIYTMTGAHLYSENGLEINTSRLSEGMYLFEIVTKAGDRSIKRVIIQ